MQQPRWKGKHYSFFQNKECEYFPCHQGISEGRFNCLFCYCPLYVLGEACGGNPVITEKGIKDCTHCTLPHDPDNYGYVTEQFGRIQEVMEKKGSDQLPPASFDRSGKCLYQQGQYQNREIAVEKLQLAVADGDYEMIEGTLWAALHLFQEYPFQTAKGLQYSYVIKGNEIFFSRKEKSVTRATVDIALQTALDLQRAGIAIKGPKQLRCFGASYLYPVFIEIGIINENRT